VQGKNLFVLLESPSTALRVTKSFGKAAGKWIAGKAQAFRF